MATFSKQKLSGSTNGKNILVVATATAGTLMHTAVTGTTDWDEVWMWAQNTETTARKLTIEWGEATAPNGNIELTIPAEAGPVLVIPGWIIQNGLEIRAFSAAANTTVINGYVNRITA